MQKRIAIVAVLLCLAALCAGCMPAANNPSNEGNFRGRNSTEIPDSLETNEQGVPILKVYDTQTEKIEEMDLETYVMGVLAGEMKNDWPLEALKAQAILARTFVLKFVETKDSKYEGADISTDVSEAQAYSEANINEAIRTAVEQTRGMVLSYEGELPQAWFHAHAGGKTELPSVALDYKDGDPDYLSVVDSPDSEDAPEEVKNWTATFTAEQVGKACADTGVQTGTVQSVEIESRGESGRVERFKINGVSVSAPSLRIQIGANKLKSTLIDRVTVQDGEVTFEGRGFGHGVGLSQWGAYAMAEDGKNAEEIVLHYFQGVGIAKIWD